MMLLIDVGNSYVKVSQYYEEQIKLICRFDLSKLTDLTSLKFEQNLLCKPSKAFYISVSSEINNRLLEAAMLDMFGITLERLYSKSSCELLTNGYEKYNQLGVDRWMAMLGARVKKYNNFLLVDVGTAVTIDFVINGQHQGGFIAPGLELLKESLHMPLLEKQASDFKPNLIAQPAKNTSDAINYGIQLMVASYINNISAHFLLKDDLKIDYIGTGGSFKLIAPLLEEFNGCTWQNIDDIVFIGMLESVREFVFTKE